MGKVGKYTVENRVRATDFIVGHDKNGNVKRFRGNFFLRGLANDSAYLAMLDDEVEARIAGDALLDDKIDLTKINIEALISGLEGDITTIQEDLMSVNGQIQGLATQFNNELYGVGGIVENYTALVNNTEMSLKSYIDQADAALAADYNGKITGLSDAIDLELFVGGHLDIDLLVSRFNSSPSTAQFRGSYINISPSVTFSEGYDPSEKSRVFKFTPPHPPYDIDDLRISSDGDLFVANTKRTAGQAYVDSDWTLALRYIGMYELNNALSGYATEQWVTENFSSGGGVNLEDWFSLIKPDPEDSSTWYIQTNYSLTSVKEIQAWTDNGLLPGTIWDNIPDATTTSKGVVQIGNGINVSNGVISLDQSTITPQTLSLSGNNLTISGGNTVDLGTVLPDLSWANITDKPATATRWPSWSEVTSKPTELGYLDGVTSGIQEQLNSKLNASVFSDMFELVTTTNGSYIRAKYGLASDFELTAYADSGQSLPSIFDNLPKASTGAYGVVKIGSNIDVTDGVISVSGNALNPTLGFVNNILSVNASTVDLSSLETDLSNYYTKTETNTLLGAKANKNGSSVEDFIVKDLTVHGTVNHWLADVITVDDARLQLNRTQEGATVASGLDIYNGTNVVSSLLYDTSGVWRAGGQRIYTDNYHPLADSATNALSLGGYSAASYPRKAEAAVITGWWNFQGASPRFYIEDTTQQKKIGFTNSGSSLLLSRYAFGTGTHQATLLNIKIDAPNNSFRIESNGYVGLGVTATERLHVAGNVRANNFIIPRGGMLTTYTTDTYTFNGKTLPWYGIGIDVTSDTLSELHLGGYGGVRMRSGAGSARLHINGNFGINQDNPTERLHVVGNGLFTGNLTAQGEVTAYLSSDSRLKQNIKPITSALDIIEGLNPVSYNWNKKAIALNSIKDDIRTNYGVIAQEVEKILPDLVHQTNGYKSVDYIQMIGILLAGVRELNCRINNLENR